MSFVRDDVQPLATQDSLQSLLDGVSCGFLLNDVRETDERLGIGTFGTVFKGYWCHAPVAIKRLHDTLMYKETGEPSLDSKNFIKEISLHRVLRHPNIAQILGVIEPRSGHEQGSPGIVFELLEQSLKKRYKNESLQRLRESQQVEIGRGVAAGLHYMHTVGILHRDLTTRNIMLSQRGDGDYHAKITDMGVSRAIAIGSIVHRMSCNPGNPSYMAPETEWYDDPDKQAEYGPKSDCFSYGIAMLAMCVRREPPPPAVVAKRGRRDLANMRSDSPDHPLLPIIVQCLEEKPEKRPSADDICDGLKPLREILATPAASPVNPPGTPVIGDAKRHDSVSRSTSASQTIFTPPRSVSSPQQIVGSPNADSRIPMKPRELFPSSSPADTPAGEASGAVAGNDEYLYHLEDLQSVDVTEQTCAGAGITPYRQSTIVNPGPWTRILHHRPSVAGAEKLSVADICATAGADTELGMLGRCYRMFNVCASTEMQPPKCIPKWLQLMKLPRHSRRRCQLACVHDGLLHCAFQRHQEGSVAILYCLDTASIGGGGGWKRSRMPPGEHWHWRCYLTSTALGLVCVCINEHKTGCYKVMLRSKDTHEWEPLGELPLVKFSFGVAVNGTELIVVGGRGSLRVQGGNVSTVHSFDLSTRKWQSWADLPHATADVSLAVHRDHLHVFGHSGLVRDDATCVMSADLGKPLSEREWTMDVHCRIPRKLCGSVVLGDHLIICGGLEASLVSLDWKRDCSNAAFMYTPDGDRSRWLALPHLVTPQSFPAIVTDGQRLICFGGISDIDTLVQFVEVLEI
eukprot:scpid25323/ scgid9783/ Raf homolog serine/threonine-protein kinase phl; Protein pole-hole